MFCSKNNCIFTPKINNNVSLKIKIKMKKLVLFLVLFSITAMAVCQIHVTWNGFVGVGTNNPYAKLQIAQNGNDFTFKPANPGPEIGGWDGTSSTQILFWHTNAGWNRIKTAGHTTYSDSTLKTEITPLRNATATLTQLKTYSYYFKSDDIKTRKRDYGVLAQEIAAILPELVDTAKGTMFVNYNAFIGFLIRGFNEQQSIIEKQQNTIENLQKKVEALEKYCGKGNEKPEFSGETREMKLQQNAPNPFSSTTTIQCYIPQEMGKVQLCIYNMQGAQVKCIPVTDRGDVTVTLSAGQLAIGVYTYLLIGDNQTSDAKQMILTK